MSDFINYIFLYEFGLNGRFWRYTSNAENVIDIDGNEWEACPISDDGVKQSGEAASDALNITASVDTVPARLFMYSPPSKMMSIVKYRAEFDPKPRVSEVTGLVSTPDSRVHPVTNKRVLYDGEVGQCSFAGDPGTVGFTCETLSASMRREGLRLPWQRQCPFAIYDQSTCKLDKSSRGVVAVITAINGVSVSLDSIGSIPDGHMAGGFLEFQHPVKGMETLAVESASGTDLVIFGSTIELWVGMTVTIYPGCNQSPDRCKSYGNYLNYGGFEALPGKSPFNGDPVF